ncbi:MAG: GapR family DNA-binding domain-containing protein [Hyphomicrobium sp.]
MPGDEIMELGDNSAKQLAGIIERLESLEAEKAKSAESIKAEKALAAAAGFDVKAINQLLKDRKGDTDKTTEARAITETYRKALAEQPGEIGEWASAFNAAQQSAKSRRPAAKLKKDDGGGRFN